MNGRVSAKLGFRSTRRILLATTLGLAASAAPASAAGLPETPAPDVLPKCVPGAQRLCIPIVGTDATASRSLATLTTSSRRRLGLGLPPAGRLLGRRAAKLLAASDRKLAALLAAPLTEPKARSAASAKIRRGLGAKESI